MQNKNNKNLVMMLLIVIMLLLAGASYLVNSLKTDLKEERIALKKEKLRNDELVKVNETQYRKLVADTLKQRELNKIVDSLEIELEAKPKVVYKIKYVPKEVEKPVDSIKIDKDSVQVEDYYPQKDNYFVKYKNKISLADSTGIGEWTFQPISLSGVISQREDGIFQADFKTPEWLKIEDVDIQAIPLEPPKIDNFGWILGGGLGKDFKADETFVRLSAGLRYKKFFLDVGATTNQTLDAGIKVEF